MSFELRWMGAVGVGVGESRFEGGSKPKVVGEALMWVKCGPRRSGSGGGQSNWFDRLAPRGTP